MQRIGSSSPLLEVRDLQVILAVAAAGSTAGACRELHLTQSAVSRAVLLAENKLGARIFERTARGLIPTPVGERLVTGAGSLLAQFAKLEDSARDPVTAPTRLRLVCECYTAYRWLFSAVAKMREELPSLDVTLSIEHTSDPVKGLLSGEVDVALLTTQTVSGGLSEQPLFSDEIVFLMAASHPLATRASLKARDLCDHPLIGSTLTPLPEKEWFLRRVFGRQRPKLRVLRFPTTEAVVDAARAGLGVAILSEWIAGIYLRGGDLVAKRLASEPLRRPWRIAFRPEVADAARRLASELEGSIPRGVVGSAALRAIPGG